jgi:ABC-type uncharacterized transport system ATPase subunit
MVLLGPVVGRFTQEVLDPIILRVFAILFKNGELPMPPEEIQGQEIDIAYISALARAQKSSGIYQIQSFLQDVGMIAQAKPEALDKVNADKTIDEIALIRGISPDLIVSDREVAGIRDARAQAQAEAVQAQKMAQGIQTVATGAGAVKDIADSQSQEKK